MILMDLKEVFDLIAQDWSNKRQYPHPEQIKKVAHWKGKILEKKRRWFGTF